MNETAESSRLIRYYREYIGDPERIANIYAGFGLFFLGAGLGFVAVAVFLYSTTLPVNTPQMYSVREVAGVAAGLGLPLLLSGIVVLLPVDKRMVYTAFGGLVISTLAVGLFVWAYPNNWNVTNPPDYSAQGIGLYSVGVVLVIAASGVALVTHWVERASDEAGEEQTQDRSATDEDEVTDEDVRRDIETALEDTELSWGGIDRTESRRLQLNTSSIDDVDIDTLPKTGAERRMKNEEVNDAVARLQGLQGGQTKRASGESTDTQAAALRQLREQQQKEQSPQSNEGLLNRIKNYWVMSWFRERF